MSEWEEDNGGGEFTEGVGEAEADLPRTDVAIVEDEARQRRGGADDSDKWVLGAAFICGGAEFICGGRGGEVRGPWMNCAEDCAGRNLSPNSGVGCERC